MKAIKWVRKNSSPSGTTSCFSAAFTCIAPIHPGSCNKDRIAQCSSRFATNTRQCSAMQRTSSESATALPNPANARSRIARRNVLFCLLIRYWPCFDRYPGAGNDSPVKGLVSPIIRFVHFGAAWNLSSGSISVWPAAGRLRRSCGARGRRTKFDRS